MLTVSSESYISRMLLRFFEKNEVYRSSIKDIDGLIRPVDFIPETVNINDLFKKDAVKKEPSCDGGG